MAEINETTSRNVLGVSPDEKKQADRIRLEAVRQRGETLEETQRRIERQTQMPEPPFTGTEIRHERAVDYLEKARARAQRKTLEHQRASNPTGTPSSKPFSRYTPEEKRLRAGERKEAQDIAKESSRERYDRAQAELGQPAVGPAPVERRDVVKTRGFLGKEKRVGKGPVRRVRGIDQLLERVRPEEYSLYGPSGTLVIYNEPGPFGRNFYRVKFQGRSFAPAFDTREQAQAFVADLKARAEPEYAARRERMVQADRRFFTETTLAHRQHPLFVRVVDKTRPPPKRLVS